MWKVCHIYRQVAVYLRRGGCRYVSWCLRTFIVTLVSEPCEAGRSSAGEAVAHRGCPAASETDTPNLSLVCSPHLCPNHRPCQCLWRWSGGRAASVYWEGLLATPPSPVVLSSGSLMGGLASGSTVPAGRSASLMGSSDPVLCVPGPPSTCWDSVSGLVMFCFFLRCGGVTPLTSGYPDPPTRNGGPMDGASTPAILAVELQPHLLRY